MSTADIRREAIHIVNEVLRKLGLNTVANLDSTKQSQLLTDFLNDVVDEISDFGDWQEMLRTQKVTAQSSVVRYEIATSGNLKNIVEIAWGDQPASMELRTIEDIRLLTRVGSYGTPRQWAVVGVSGVNPLVDVFPAPTTASMSAQTSAGGVFDVLYYKKPSFIAAVTANNSAIPAFPARMLVMGVYAKALLQENGGEPSNEFQVVFTEYMRMRQEALNRFNADSGTDVYITPTGSRYG